MGQTASVPPSEVARPLERYRNPKFSIPDNARAEAQGCKMYRAAERLERQTGIPISVAELAAARRVVTMPAVKTLVGVSSLFYPTDVDTGKFIRSSVVGEGLGRNERQVRLRAAMSTTCNLRPARRELHIKKHLHA